MNPFEKMRAGDKSALHDLLRTQGDEIVRIADAIGDATDDALLEIARDVWSESAVLWTPPDDVAALVQKLAAATCARRALARLERDVGRLRVDVRIAARAFAGFTDAATQRALDSRVAPIADATSRALANVLSSSSPGSAGRFEALWQKIDALLK